MNKKSRMSVAKDGSALHVYPGEKELRDMLQWRHGVYVEWGTWDDGQPSIRTREAKEGEPAIVLSRDKHGLFLRVPLPEGTKVEYKK